MDADEVFWEKILTTTAQECYELYWKFLEATFYETKVVRPPSSYL